MAAFNEPPRAGSEPKGAGWRRLEPPAQVRAYVASNWHDARAVDINDDTREIRIEWPPPVEDATIELIRHRILEAALYQAAPGALSSTRT